MFSSCAQKENNVMRKRERASSRDRDESGCPAYILAAVDEFVDGHHSVFVLIHLLLERKKKMKSGFWSRSTAAEMDGAARDSPGKTPLRADGASPLWGRGMCIFPSCRRWPSWCPAFPATRRKNMSWKVWRQICCSARIIQINTILDRILSLRPLLTRTYFFSDVSVFIDVIQVESPVEFLLDRASQEDRKAHDKILQRKQDSKDKTETNKMQIYFALAQFVSPFLRGHYVGL